LRKKALGLYFGGISDPAAVQDCTKCPSLLTNVQLVGDIINGSCYQRYEKRLEQLKGCPTSPVATGSLVGLDPQTKLQAPQH